MAKKESAAEERERLVATLQNKFARWEQLYTDGGFDPFWPDGTNLNLVRNHIRISMNKIALVFSPAERPVLWSHELPPEVPENYMAHAETYRAFAEERIASGELPLEKAVWYRQLLEKRRPC